MMFWVVVLICLVLSAFLTGIVRGFAIRKSILDIPNARSSHSVPTPRGGGIAIVISFLLGTILVGSYQLASREIVIALLGSGFLVALIGFFDDLGHIPARWRLIGHFGAAAWGLFWLGGGPELTIAGFSLEPGLVSGIVTSLFLVWMLNLFNFMDGIDGIASVEAVSVCAGGVVLCFFTGMENQALLPLLLAVCSLGFLFWNFPPAKIFMGDAGSGFLGIVLGLFSLQAAWYDQNLFWGWVILMGAFIVDATFTLIRRLYRGEKVYEAHRSHAYQFASRRYGSHKAVTITVGAINIFWLLPMAVIVALGFITPLMGLAIAFLPLLLLVLKYNAGGTEAC